MRSSPGLYGQTVVPVICAFVRGAKKESIGKLDENGERHLSEIDDDDVEEWVDIGTDVQVAVSLLGRNHALIAELAIAMDLRGANLEGADLCGVSLEGVDLRWANFRGANLEETSSAGDEQHSDTSRATCSISGLAQHISARYTALQPYAVATGTTSPVAAALQPEIDPGFVANDQATK